ncbi:hypothetical protein [Mucilaginibacter lappiensis]|uniref:Nickel transport protein n=1 Tax=Mucilaginibacter lappiensis TaxID=354630 RepID=A0A841JH71_9SPHI|nr:hypothetical protein [Mucilaginibacter lappiensis]MBB6127381.1 hypothetical protein [Mucilaginibacter lappiensis]
MKQIIFLFLFFLPFTGEASAYWLEVKGSGKLNEPVQIQVCYGHIDEFSIRHRDTGNELELTGNFKIGVLDQEGKIIQVPILRKADCWEGNFIPVHEGTYRILGINDSHPVVDRSKSGGKNVRPIDYLCAAYQVGGGGAVSKPAQLLDIVVTRKGDLINVQAFNNGHFAENQTKLRVFNPENWEKELVTNDRGEAFFKTTMPGLYIIREDLDDPTSGNYKGVAYTSIRYRCNYCLLIP